MKSKVTKIHPDGATVTRADGSAVNVGDEVDLSESHTITIPIGASGGSVSVEHGGASFVVHERAASPPRPLTIAGTVEGGPFGAESVTVVIAPKVAPALAIGDTATPSRASAPVGRVPRAIPPVLKIE